jgi:flagellum-specific peptidoglycan hydrolase FlgJ
LSAKKSPTAFTFFVYLKLLEIARKTPDVGVKKRNSEDHTLDELYRGLLRGLAFFLPGVALALYWGEIDRGFRGAGDLPVLIRITKEYQEGSGYAFELLRKQAAAFYASRQADWSSGSKGGPFTMREARTIHEAWRREDMETKLGQHFRAGRMQSAQRYLDYIETYKELAARQMYSTGIPASIILSQGLLESDAGRSRLTRNTNNHFGVKCLKRKGYLDDGVIDDHDFYHHRLAQGCMQYKDDHEWDRFEVYANPELSYLRHSELLSTSSRYNWMLRSYQIGENYHLSSRWLGKGEAPYYAAWAAGLKENGYATGKRYANKLAWIIDTYELWRIDYGVVHATQR